jgi:hypothetical protein
LESNASYLTEFFGILNSLGDEVIIVLVWLFSCHIEGGFDEGLTTP